VHESTKSDEQVGLTRLGDATAVQFGATAVRARLRGRDVLLIAHPWYLRHDDLGILDGAMLGSEPQPSMAATSRYACPVPLC
jgi:hypothetical protein